MESLCSACRILSLRLAAQTSSTTRTATTPSLRAFSTSLPRAAAPAKNKAQVTAKQKEKARRKKKKYVFYKMPELKDLTQYPLLDAMQYIKAFEVGRSASTPKYELALRLKTKKDGPVIRNQIRLPHPVKTDIKVCALVAADSKQGRAAKDAGASLVGEEELFDMIKSGKVDMDRCITTPEMLPKMTKAGLPRVLGPRGLMPSAKLGTVSDNLGQTVKNMMGGSTYRERRGVVSMAIGQLGFTAEQLKRNVSALIAQIRKEGNVIQERDGFPKDVYEVVLSSTNSPGFSLNGDFKGPTSTSTTQLNVL